MFLQISVVSTFSIFIPFSALLLEKKKFGLFRGIAWFIFMSVISELFFFVTSRMGIPNLRYFHLYTLLEFLSLSIFFATMLRLRRNSIFLGVVTVFSVYLAINPFLLEAPDRYNSISRSLESLVLMFFCALYFYGVYREEKVISLDEEPDFWFVGGLSIYLSVGLFTHLLASHILKGSVKHDTLMTSYAFLQVSNVVKNIFITIGIWKGSR